MDAVPVWFVGSIIILLLAETAVYVIERVRKKDRERT